MRAQLVIAVLSICCALCGLAAGSASAAQRVDLKVLLLGAEGTEPSFLAWQAQLRREGVPFDQLIATPGHAPITAASLSTTTGTTEEARYQAVIVAVGGLPRCGESGCASALSAEEWIALQTYEATFHVRQLTAYTFPNAEHGLNPPTSSGPLDGTSASLTAAGQTVFPYLNGAVTIGAGTYGYGATPLDATTFSTLLSDPSGDSLVGVFTHPDGREEMVQTFDSNQFQVHAELLRHGQLAWVTRGTYLGNQRNYLELQVDDIFLPDDIWNTTDHVTDFNPEDAVRMSAADVTRAVEWSRTTGLRIDNLFNGGGSVQYAEANGGRDPLLTAFQANKAAFGWVSHTYDHPNLDCSARGFIVEEIEDNVSWARRAGFAINRAELVTGEHSGLANLIPGFPGTIDPPGLEEAEASGSGGTLAAGAYDYAVSATSTNGETNASTTTVTVPAAGGRRAVAARGSARITWDAICHATSYMVYRRSSPAGAWSLIGTVAQPANAFRAGGPASIRFRDTGAAGSAASPPSANGATLDPYGQNPNFAGALRAAGVTNTGGDASKPYPVTPTSTTGPTYPAGTSFVDGSARVIPRYPTNVYYNVATQAQLTDEYNHLYLPPELGGVCVNTSTTTCRSSPASWNDIVEAESQRIFGHMMGNDPRPHYFHQTNLAESSSPEGAVFYPVLDATIAEYKGFFNATAPILQLTPTQISALLSEQEAWATASASTVTGYIEGGSVTITNTARAAATIPLSGTEAGTLYGGTRSGWIAAARGSSTHTAAVAWPAATPPPAPPAPASSLAAVTALVQHAGAAVTAGATAPMATP
jgi:hypothetical protein